MKKIVSLMMFVLIESSVVLCVVLLYQANKQLLTANEIFDNTVEVLRSRNFSKASLESITSNQTYQFRIKKVEPYKYEVSMDFHMHLSNEKKTLRMMVYQPR